MRNLGACLARLFHGAEIPHGYAHRFRDTFAVRLLAKGASLYDVAKLLGISHSTAERHYSRYVKELQERGARLVGSLDFAKPAVTKLSPASPTFGHFRRTSGETQ